MAPVIAQLVERETVVGWFTVISRPAVRLRLAGGVNIFLQLITVDIPLKTASDHLFPAAVHLKKAFFANLHLRWGMISHPYPTRVACPRWSSG